MLRRCLGNLASEFKFVPLIPKVGHSDITYRLLTRDYISVVNPGNGLPEILRVEPEALRLLAFTAFDDVEHLLRSSHLESLRSIFNDPEASENDRFVALQLLKNASISAGRIMPGCQDTGTAIIAGYRGEQVYVRGNDEEALSRGVYDVFQKRNLRFSQNVPLNMFDEKNTGTNLPAQIDLYATKGMEYNFMFVAKGGGSANKSFLFQETRSILNPKSLRKFLKEKLFMFGTAACPPYHVCVVIGGTSAETTLKTVKYGSCHYYDDLPSQPDPEAVYTFRDLEMEKEVLRICQEIGMGAQFGGKYYAHDARVIRMPRHGASCPIGIGVSCSADRQALAKINRDGVWLEELETDPAKYMPEVTEEHLFNTPPVKIDLNRPMREILAELSRYPVKTRLSLTGTIVVARDMAHAKIRDLLERGKPMPEYFRNYPVYYAGPAKKPKGCPSGSFGPTTAGRMDVFVDTFQSHGGSMIMLAKGNRSKMVTDACKKHGGFYLGSIGGPAAVLATDCIKKVEILDMEELGMEAVWKIEVENFPAFIVVDDKGNDFFMELKTKNSSFGKIRGQVMHRLPRKSFIDLVWPSYAAVATRVSQRVLFTKMPLEGAMHQPGESGQEAGSGDTITGKETWSQFSAKMRFGRRRIRVIDIAAKMSYEYQMLKKMCRRRPAMRQWSVRDDFCDMSPGVVIMSPSLQAAFMKVFRLKDKSLIRMCLRDIIPIIEYRNREERPSVPIRGEDMIPEGEPDTLNQKKRELFERREKNLNHGRLFLHDKRSQAKLRFKIRQRLIRFQRQLAVANAVASRTVLYSADDAIGYFLFRGAAMYAGMHRVFFELAKQLPHFVPKTMLDFGAGTGTAILVAKEVYDPSALAYPLYRSLRQTRTWNDSSQAHQLSELQYDLRRLERNNAEKRKARFMAVASLIESGEIDPVDIPADLRREIADVAAHAATRKKSRLAQEAHARHREVVDGTEWEHGNSLSAEPGNANEDRPSLFEGESDDDASIDNVQRSESSGAESCNRTWWERLVDLENSTAQQRVQRQLRPLQEVTAIEPSPGMMEIGTMVLHDDVPNVTWKRYLLPEDESIQHDLVTAAYTLSEIAQSENRRKIVQQLWRMTNGVLVLVEFANLSNFNLLMEARDVILEEKGVGLWDWQPTIVAPCPHESRCPLRHCKAGVKHKRMRICSTEVQYRSTFIEAWARALPLKLGIEPITYIIFARNERVPERAERRESQLQHTEAAQAQARDEKQRAMHEAALSIKDAVFERLSDEALHRPLTGVPPKLQLFTGNGGGDQVVASTEPRTAANPSPSHPPALNEGVASTSGVAHLPSHQPRLVKTSADRYNKLIFPLQYPPALHKYNRSFVDAGHQRQRAITPSEMLVVKEELEDMQRRVAKVAPQYLRVVRDPSCRGKIQADFCTPSADLITARVYRRFYGDRNRASRHSTMRWQHIGGWKLLKRIRSGSLFPHDVPLYAVRKHAQVDFPNTFVGVKHSAVEKTAMQYNDPQTFMDTPDEDLAREELHLKRRLLRERELERRAQQQVEDLLGVKVADRDLSGSVGTHRDISAEQWADAVRRARIKTVLQTKQTIPFASKMRAAKRLLEVRRRNMKLEMKSHRQRKT